MHAYPLRPAVLVALAGVLLAGCGAVEFDHPLTDEKTSVVDERLIGVWEPTRETLGTGQHQDGLLIPRLAVGRDRKQANLMEAVSLEVEDGYVEVDRIALRATSIGKHRYLSVRDPEESERWWVVRYHLPEENLLRFQVLDVEVLAKAVESGALEGEVLRPSEEADDFADLQVRISSKPAAVRAWLEAHADACVQEDAAEMRRLVKKPEWELLEEGPDEEDDAEGE